MALHCSLPVVVLHALEAQLFFITPTANEENQAFKKRNLGDSMIWIYTYMSH